MTRRVDSDLLERCAPWFARLAWVAVAVVGGGAVSGTVDGRSAAVQWVAAIGCWGAWAVVMGGLAVASVRTLTLVRVGTPLSAVVVVVTAIGGADGLELAGLTVPTILIVAVVFNAEFGRAFVQASAYGDEQRFPLRPPAAAGLAAVLAWVLWAAAAVAAPLLLAARSWIVGAVTLVVAVVGLGVLAPRWHRLARRWLVYVPAGVVVHDPVVLADTLTMRRAQISAIALAPADTEAADLTGPASGYALEVSTTETVTVVLAPTPRAPTGRALHLTALLVCPSRPGRALEIAAARRLPVR